MNRITRWLMAPFLLVFAILATLTDHISTLRSRLDPFDDIGLRLARVTRFRRQYGDRLLLAFSLVAMTALNASALPVFDTHTGVHKWTIFSRLGFAGAGVYGLVGATDQQQKYPFRMGTLRRRINIGQFTVTPGGAIPAITIPQVGMISRILVNVSGTYTKANASGLNLLDGYDAIMARAQLMLNNGSANIVDLSGVGVNIINRDLSAGSLPVKRGLVTTAGAQTFAYKYILPVNANQRRQFEMGLINLQAPELRATLNLSFNPLSSIFATPADVTLFAATANVSYEYFEIPDVNMFTLPPLTIVRTIEESPLAITSVGDNPYQIPRLGTMIDYHIVMVLNNAYASVLNNLTEWKFRYNKSDTQYDILIGDLETYEAEQYGMGQGPTQTFLFANALSFNFWAAGDRDWNGGDFRDAIDTEENTTTESTPTVGANVSFNAGKDNFYHVRRVVQRIVSAAAPAA